MKNWVFPYREENSGFLTQYICNITFFCMHSSGNEIGKERQRRKKLKNLVSKKNIFQKELFPKRIIFQIMHK